MMSLKAPIRSICFGVAIGVIPVAWILRLLLWPLVKTLRISIWTGSPILTLAKNCKAERLIGYNSISLVRSSYFITDEFDINLQAISWGIPLVRSLLPYLAFLLILILAVQVHAYIDGGVLPPLGRLQFNRLELISYRLFGIHLMLWSYGADVRTREQTLIIGNPNCCTDCTQVGVACVCDDGIGKANYQLVHANSTAVFSMGDMIEYTPGSINDLFFWPIDLAADSEERYRPIYPISCDQRPLRIVHAPNHREFKGSRYLEEAVDSLVAEGSQIDLILIERLSNDKALDIYRSADLIFDQCLIGFHGYFALEAMALGKPVMCFIRKPDVYLLAPEECPIINTHVNTLENDLRHVLAHRNQLADIGRRGRAYIEKHYSLAAFASRLEHTYRALGVLK